MLKYNLQLIVVSAIVFCGSVAFAAFQFDGAPDPHEKTQSTRKSGDMLIFYNGYSGRRAARRALSGRRGSLHNRSYRGGGLRGGK